MRAKLFANALLTAATAAALVPRGACAQEIRVEPPQVVLRPRVEIAPVAIPVPEINISLPQIEVPIPPIPPVPPLLEIQGPGVYINDGDFWFGDEQIEREELRQSFTLQVGARVELTDIDGPVQIDTVEGQTGEVIIRSYSAGQNPRKLTFEQTSVSLTIRGADAKQRDRLDAFDRTSHQIRLTLPRRANLTLTNVANSVRVGELDGTVKLTNVSGRVGLAQVAGSAELSNVAGTVSLTVERLGGRGVSLSNVAGSVSLRFVGDVNAELQTSNITGKVYVELPDVAVQGEMSRTDFRAKIGAGGAPIRVSNVTGTVRLSQAQTVAEMLNTFKSSTRSYDRIKLVNDLALHVSNPQVRRAFVVALNSEENSAVQITAARELAPYIREPEVRDAFMRALDSNKNDVVRMTVVRAVAKNYADEKAMREQLLRALVAEKKDAVRMTILDAISKYADDPAVVRALSDALKNDQKDVVRLRAAHALAARIDDPGVYALLLNAARSDAKKYVRAQALDALSRRIRDRAELRALFIGYLDDESMSLQYHALKGLVELGDTSLKPRLVEKSRELILANARRGWNDRMVLSALVLLRKLDPTEADRVLEQLDGESFRASRN